MVFTPHIMRRELWKISGHEENYGENMYPAMELDDAEYRLKPMNCPGHILIYKNSPRSYRDLPQRYAELGNVYRYKRSGTMHGLLRVRGFTQDDAHIFCTPEQIEDEIGGCIDFAESVLKTFGFEEFKVELSTWDPGDKKFIGSAEKWDGAVGSLTKVLDRKGMRHTRTPADYEIGYRHVKGPANEWFIAARLEFERKPGVNTDAIKELLDKRRETQPIGEWSCGSVFTNPPGDHAARLIEASGLKGFRIGDASVSEKHANFIINHGQARAADIEALIEHVQKTVAQAQGVELHTEVRIVGEAA